MARKKGLSFTACCGSGFALAAVAVAVILIAASFRTLDATTYGLAYDSLWCTIDRTTLYNNGLFFVGPTTVFLTFPKATRDVYDTLPARTRDGLTVGLELSFQYRLQQSADSLAELYMMFGLEYESAFRREARDVLRNAASGFTAFECWRNRTALVVSMQAELDTALSRWYANVEAFQVGRRRRRRRRSPRPTDRPPAPARAARAPLTAPFPPSQLLEIGLPDRFATSIDDMEIAQQEVETAELEQGVAMTFARGSAGVHFMQVAGGSCVMMQLTCWAPPEGDVPHYVCQVHVDGPAKRVTLRRDFVPRAPGGRERYFDADLEKSVMVTKACVGYEPAAPLFPPESAGPMSIEMAIPLKFDDAPSRMAFEKVAAAVGTGAKRWAGWLEGGGEGAAAGDDAASRARVSAALTEFAEANFGAECRELHGDFFGAAT